MNKIVHFEQWNNENIIQHRATFLEEIKRKMAIKFIGDKPVHNR